MGAPCKAEASRRSVKLSPDGNLVRQASGSFADEYSTF